ncbi:energy transducer TonB [Flavobacterium akiainvivens]|uniref:energy transducer TonB n=1 Tax=Flavobacterium akiainvivens TaxID=1202724 RepID=UPI0006C88DEE|nr:energy transducer TonB [Flavobacterium akiainvivens]SFQ17027.1 TonB protein C-terminal [Flavobacterium akiainvivens]
MKKILFTTLLFASLIGFAQDKDTKVPAPEIKTGRDPHHNSKESDQPISDNIYAPEATNSDEPINYAALQVKPKYPGGFDAFYAYVNDNINTSKLTPEAKAQKQLKVTVSFTVERDGTMTGLQIIKDPGFGFGPEMLRVLRSIKTKWSPGMQNKKAVRTNYILPIVYTLPKTGEEVPLSIIKETNYETSEQGTEEPVDHKTIQVKPEFPGGLKNFHNYVNRNIKPENIEATAKGQKLTATISFIVEKDGSMTNFSVVEDPGFGFYKEVVRVLQSIKTKWNPGIQNGKPVRSTFTFPVTIAVPQ